MLPILSYSQAVAYLKEWRPISCYSEAYDFLEDLRSQVKYEGLYQHFFPEKYKQSQAIDIPAPGKYLSEKDIEFMELVSGYFFDMPADLEEFADDKFSCKCIPVLADTRDWDEYVYHASLGGRLLVLLGQHSQIGGMFDCLIDLSETEEEKEIISWAYYQMDDGNKTIDMERLGDLCETDKFPLSFLPRALEMTWYSSGNMFVDYIDMPLDFEWTIENITQLKREFEEAITMDENFQLLANWIDENSYNNFTKVLNIWKSCLVFTAR